VNKIISISIELFLFVLISVVNIHGEYMAGLGVFNKEVWVKKDFDAIIMNEVKKHESTALAEQGNQELVGLNIELPDISLRDSIVQVRSLIMANYIYSGPYKETITIPANGIMLKSEESSSFDGVDILTITFIDTKHQVTYTCTQEKLYKIWERNRIATVRFFESRMPDENGQSLCYSVHISGSL